MSHTNRQKLTGLSFSLHGPALASHSIPKTEVLAEFDQVGSAWIRVSFDYEPGQIAITDRDPNDCQEGFGESFDITAITNLEPIALDCNGMKLTIPAGTDLFNLIGEYYCGCILDDLVSEVTA